MNKLSAKYVLILCFCEIVDLDSVKGFNDSFDKDWEQMFPNSLNGWKGCFPNYTDNCVAKIKNDSNFQQCVQVLEEDWKEVDKQTKTEIEKQTCCSKYDYSDCWKKSAKRHCDSSVFAEVRKIIDKKIKGLEIDCPDFVYGSSKCHFPIWLILIFSFLGILFIASFVFIEIKRRYALNSIN
jgi:hypothetical protein